MNGKKWLIAVALAILVSGPIDGQCDPPKNPNDGWLLDENKVPDVAISDPDESNSSDELSLDSLHVVAWLLGGGFVGLLALRRRFKNY
jgi:hypothetical protein